MPFINVKIIEGVFTSEQKHEIARKLTDTMVSIEGENLRTVTWCVIEEVASGDWAIGGNSLTTEDVLALAQGQPVGLNPLYGIAIGTRLMTAFSQSSRPKAPSSVEQCTVTTERGPGRGGVFTASRRKCGTRPCGSRESRSGRFLPQRLHCPAGLG